MTLPQGFGDLSEGGGHGCPGSVGFFVDESSNPDRRNFCVRDLSKLVVNFKEGVLS